MNKNTIAVWFSCGVASAVASKITIEKYGNTHKVLIVNNPIKNEHPDNTRFLKDVENWIGGKIIKAVNKNFPNADISEVFNKRKYMSGVKGAPCTSELKKHARYQFESANKIDWHVLGFTIDEINRHNRFTKYERANVLPVLIDAGLTKADCFRIVEKVGIKLPLIYSMGFPNANCIGCIKSSSPSYWNLVRKTFPKVFDERAEQSRKMGCRLVKRKGKRIFLDELLETDKGGKIKSYECGIFCDTS